MRWGGWGESEYGKDKMAQNSLKAAYESLLDFNL
jgi:hypothetical protein